MPESLKHSENFHSLAEAIPHIVWIATPDGALEYCNERWYKYTGLTEQETVGGGWKSVLHPDERDKCTDYWHNSISTGQDFELEYRLKRGSDNSYRWYLSRSVAVRDAAGLITGWFGTCTEIDEQKNTVELLEKRFLERTDELSRQKALFETVVNSLSDGVMVADSTGKFLVVNPAAKRITGVPHTDAPVKDWSEVYGCYKTDGVTPYPPYDLPLARAMRGESTDDVDLVLKNPGLDSTVTIRISGRPLEIAPGTPPGGVIVLRDTTARLKYERALANSNAELERFAYVAAHDLQAPLRAVVSYAGLLQKHLSKAADETTTKYLANITEGAFRMQALIKDLLQFSQIERDGLDVSPIDLQALVAKVSKMLTVPIEVSNATIIAKALPTIMGYDGQILRLFLNLIENSIKFRGHENPKIEITAKEKAGRMLISVKDNGIGMDPQYTKRVFELFQRLHTRDEYPGTGIGLAVCKKIVERHGGEIMIESQEGCGSVIIFDLPACK